MRTFLFCWLYLGVAIAIPPKNCCNNNSVLLKKKYVCWEPVSNATSKIDSLSCKNQLKLSKFSINTEGQLIIPLHKINGQDIVIDNDSFCIGNQTNIFDVDLKNTTLAAVICTGEEEKIIDDSVSGYCMLVSVVFLLLTAAIYAVLPELSDLQGKSLVSFCLSMALGLAILSIMKLVAYSDMKLCAVRGFLVYFLILASFFWTNAISIQILTSIRRPSIMDYKWKAFLWYAAYAWGVPAVLTLCMAAVNFLPGNHQRPGIGLMHCWFYDTKNQWYYMYSVMSILIFANICIFIYTSVCLWKSTFATNHLKALRYKFVMTVRLFVVMGLTWMFEMISSLMETSIIWAIIDIFNVLQGLLIFVLLVITRKRALKAMYKHGWLDCIGGVVERYLAVKDDDEQDVIEHNGSVPMEEK